MKKTSIYDTKIYSPKHGILIKSRSLESKVKYINAFICDINEGKILTAASKLVELGLKDAGYKYVNVDDCSSIKEGREKRTQRLLPDASRCPNGIHGSADKIHTMDLKIGIYSDAGTLTCGDYLGSLGFEDIDGETWAEWDIDYLKYDSCNVPENWTDTCDFCVPDSSYPYELVNGTCLSYPGLCSEGYNYFKSDSYERFRRMQEANQTRRMSGDIYLQWHRILEILNENSFYLNNVDLLGHSDADMLEAAMKSPLLIGTDLSRISTADLAILKNEHLLTFNQDPIFGAPAMPYKWGTNPDWTFNRSFPAEYWSGQSAHGTLVLMFNPYPVTVNQTMTWAEIPSLQEHGPYCVLDVWTNMNLGPVDESMSVLIESRDTGVYLVT
ncbi:glycoside hydrolase family 27 protein [Patellaria atrata CBS 101060]|uniref:Alpha-galactosidase n=1 Tax=Patellaria atrata CBS 101060 TaxID=1346257 RepID=A0A9P4SKZ5_9PEZI|nr:glycoside hydrolase family 27 protein [Patellaria atrata CBS 101060]